MISGQFFSKIFLLNCLCRVDVDASADDLIHPIGRKRKEENVNYGSL